MRISVWSSDVCSSDLCTDGQSSGRHFPVRPQSLQGMATVGLGRRPGHHARHSRSQHRCPRSGRKAAQQMIVATAERPVTVTDMQRSEEHTSELQSLMRISYAVFCLKQKIRNTHKKYTVN